MVTLTKATHTQYGENFLPEKPKKNPTVIGQLFKSKNYQQAIKANMTPAEPVEELVYGGVNQDGDFEVKPAPVQQPKNVQKTRPVIAPKKPVITKLQIVGCIAASVFIVAAIFALNVGLDVHLIGNFLHEASSVPFWAFTAMLTIALAISLGQITAAFRRRNDSWTKDFPPIQY